MSDMKPLRYLSLEVLLVFLLLVTVAGKPSDYCHITETKYVIVSGSTFHLTHTLQGIRASRERSFCRSSFSAARPYEARKPRQRPRTFAMEELDASSLFAVCLEEVACPVGTDNQQLPAGRKKQNSLLSMAASSLSAVDDMLRSILKSALYQTTGRMQSAG